MKTDIAVKKLVIIHEERWENLQKDEFVFNRDVAGWVKCVNDWRNTTFVKKWQEITPQECENYQFVMLIVLPDQNPNKLHKYLSIVNKANRQYKVIAYIADVTGWQMNPFLPENKRLYMDILFGCDYVLRYNVPESESYWKAIMRDKPSHFFERAYPVDQGKNVMMITLPKAREYLDQYMPDQKNSYIFVGKSLKNINEERNVICSLYVAKKIQEKTGWGVVCFANNPLGKEKDGLYKAICGLENVVELPITRWIDYMKIMRVLDVRIGIYLDSLETRGQVALDCACTKIPLVCSGSAAGYRLYPKTFVSHCRDIDKAVKMALKIIDDADFRNQVVDYAYNKVEEYSFASTKKNLEKVIGTKL